MATKQELIGEVTSTIEELENITDALDLRLSVCADEDVHNAVSLHQTTTEACKELLTKCLDELKKE